MKILDETGLSIIYLKPGEICLAEKPTLVKTVLGSCVSVTICNKRLGIGAICHATLPEFNKNKDDDNNFKYVDYSVIYMVNMFKSYGSTPKELDVKVFGGSDMFITRNLSSKKATVGTQNVIKAIDIIKKEGLIISSSEVGGTRGRKIYFYTGTGEVLLKFIRKDVMKDEA